MTVPTPREVDPREALREALMWDGSVASIHAICRWVNDGLDEPLLSYLTTVAPLGGAEVAHDVQLWTPEGLCVVAPGNWIIKDVEGFFVAALSPPEAERPHVRPETPDLAGLAEGGIDPTPVAERAGEPDQPDLRAEAIRAVEKLLAGKPWAARVVLQRACRATGDVPGWWPSDEPVGNEDGGLASRPSTAQAGQDPLKWAWDLLEKAGYPEAALEAADVARRSRAPAQEELTAEEAAAVLAYFHAAIAGHMSVSSRRTKAGPGLAKLRRLAGTEGPPASG